MSYQIEPTDFFMYGVINYILSILTLNYLDMGAFCSRYMQLIVIYLIH